MELYIDSDDVEDIQTLGQDPEYDIEYCWDCFGLEECQCEVDEPISDPDYPDFLYFSMMIEDFEEQQPYRYILPRRLSTIHEESRVDFGLSRVPTRRHPKSISAPIEEDQVDIMKKHFQLLAQERLRQMHCSEASKLPEYALLSFGSMDPI
jgi:hypothetical protein